MNQYEESKANSLLCHNPDVCDLAIIRYKLLIGSKT